MITYSTPAFVTNIYNYEYEAEVMFTPLPDGAHITVCSPPNARELAIEWAPANAASTGDLRRPPALSVALSRASIDQPHVDRAVDRALRERLIEALRARGWVVKA